MSKHSLILLAACLPLFAASTAFADGITVYVTPWLAPNAFGSPSFTPAVANELYAEMNGLSTYGAAGPTQYNAVTGPVSASQTIVTGFPSWMGVAGPTGAYANELGNRMTFGLAINGNGTLISISQLSFTANSTDPGDYLQFGHAAGYYSYTTGYEGVIYKNGVDTSGGVTYVTSGPNTQLVNAIYAQGNGNSYATDCVADPCSTVAEQQAAIADAASYPGTPYSFTGTYTLGGSSGSGTFNVLPTATPTPEPSSLLLLGTGVAGIATAIRRRYTGL